MNLNLLKVCNTIDTIMKNSSNIIADAWTIEQACLDFDRSTSLSTSFPMIDSQLSGYTVAMDEFEKLKTDPEKYTVACITTNPSNPNCKTTYIKETLSSINYLRVQKLAPTCDADFYKFYTARQDVLKTARKEFLRLKELAFEKYIPLQKTTIKTIANERGIGR